MDAAWKVIPSVIAILTGLAMLVTLGRILEKIDMLVRDVAKLNLDSADHEKRLLLLEREASAWTKLDGSTADHEKRLMQLEAIGSVPPGRPSPPPRSR